MDSNRNCFVCKRTFQILNSHNNDNDYDYDDPFKKGNQEQCKIFYSLVCRYMNLNISLIDSGSSADTNPTRTLKPSESNLIDDDSLCCCDVCVPLIKSFCDTFNQWKILQLVMNWKLETITKLMSLKTENKNASQKLERKGAMFRKALFGTVAEKSMEFPRLKLEKLEVQDSRLPAAPDPLGTQENSEFKHDGIVSTEHDDDDDEPPFPKYHIFIKEETVTENAIIEEDNAWKHKQKPILDCKVQNCTSYGAGKYECKFCGKKFISKSPLTIHLRRHTGEKPYPCEYCNARFSKRSNWKRHVAVHENIKFKCRYCKATFTSKYYLNFHESVHLEKPKFQCTFCGHGFSSNVKRKDHENTHTGRKPHKCRYCSKAFATNRGVREHEKSHRHEKCNLSNNKLSNMSRRNHLRTVHQIDDKIHQKHETNMKSLMSETGVKTEHNDASQQQNDIEFTN